MDTVVVDDLHESHDGSSISDIIELFSAPVRWRFVPDPDVAESSLGETDLFVLARRSEDVWTWSEPVDGASGCPLDGPYWTGTLDMEITDELGSFVVEAASVGVEVTDPTAEGVWLGSAEGVEATFSEEVTDGLSARIGTTFDGGLQLSFPSGESVPGSFALSHIDLETRQSGPDGRTVGVMVGTVSVE